MCIYLYPCVYVWGAYLQIVLLCDLLFDKIYYNNAPIAFPYYFMG